MYAITTAAEILGVTADALERALDRGETIGTLTKACGLDVDAMTRAVVDAELADFTVLARIAGFDPAGQVEILRDIRDYVITFVNQGEYAAEHRLGALELTAA